MSAQQRTGTNSQQIAVGLVVNLTLPDGSPYNQPGKISFLGNQIDPQTGTLSIYADFPNPDRLLLPGAYVNVVRSPRQLRSSGLWCRLLPCRPIRPAAMCWSSAPTTRCGSSRSRSASRSHRTSSSSKGLTGGEHVIVAGVQKVRPGETVQATPAPAPPQGTTGARGCGPDRQGG